MKMAKERMFLVLWVVRSLLQLLSSTVAARMQSQRMRKPLDVAVFQPN